MTRNTTKRSLPYALLSSTLGTILVSITAAWLAAASYAPAVSPVEAVPQHSSSSHLFHLSPIPPGADWTS
jgi:hypothetical protein